MDVDAPEFQDWELLHSNPTSDPEPLIPAGNTNGVDEVGSETGGLIQPNYFSIDYSQSKYMTNFNGADGSEEGSEESDNPSWIDPGSENQFIMKNSGEFWSDSGSDRSETRKFGEYELGVGGNEEITSENGRNLGESWSDTVKFEDKNKGQNSQLQDGSEGKQENGNVEDEKKKTSIVWWRKVPIELVKYCALRGVRPVWTFSVAAAVVMGFVILGRRLYKMKRKTKKLELKVSVDDKKKVSQFMSRSARLNEAFSIVKLVPVIRPQLPAPGVTMWPVMSLR